MNFLHLQAVGRHKITPCGLMHPYLLKLLQHLIYRIFSGHDFYCPQMKFVKVMFSQVSVCPQVGCLPLVPEGSAEQTHPPGQTPPKPPGRHPLGRSHLGRHLPCPVNTGIQPQSSASCDTHPPWQILRGTVNKRAVRIPLECIIV